MQAFGWPWFFASVFLLLSVFYQSAQWLLSLGGRAIGRHLRRKTAFRRESLLAQVKREEENVVQNERLLSKPDDDDWEKIESHAAGSAMNRGRRETEWTGIIGFFHPFCNAGGGGERVLWAAIKATQNRWPKAVCVVYTGDQNVSKTTILQQVENRFDIYLHHPTIVFLYLHTRHYVLSTTYPRFTLLGQSLGSLVLAYDAFSLLVPNIFIDTMGYAFTLALSKLFFPDVPTGAYVHYPTISTDMLDSLDLTTDSGLHAGAGKGWKGQLKRWYWRIFAWLYGLVGGNVDVVMTNSSWTQAHIRSLWAPQRARRHKLSEIEVVFPPVAVQEVEKAVEISESSEAQREQILLYIAQFRPEKNHALMIRAFAQLVSSRVSHVDPNTKDTKLVLIGSVRDSEDATRVYDLRLLAHELKVRDNVEFICNASWPEILAWLQRSWVGINGMWNEHFGIGVVEYQAAGLICVVNNSGGPKEDIVIDYDGKPTGFHASSDVEYATQFARALASPPEETLAMRKRARLSARRFSGEEFSKKWTRRVEQLVILQKQHLKQ